MNFREWLKECYGNEDKNLGVGTGVLVSITLYITLKILEKELYMLLLIPLSFCYFTFKYIPFWNYIKNDK